MFRWTNLTEFCVTSTAETAIYKLKKNDIALFNCKKQGASFIFSVKSEYSKKVFAIFASPCYNISIKGEKGLKPLLRRAVSRAGLFIGAALFATLCALSNGFIFKITVSGSGAYLEHEVKALVYAAGVKTNTFRAKVDEPLIISSVMALPNVTFCSVERGGSVLYINVQTNAQNAQTAQTQSLYADKAGKLVSLVALCGTAEASAGESVNAGDLLIGAYYVQNEISYPCLAVGYAKIEVSASVTYCADCESEENAALALAAPLAYSTEILTKTCTVKQTPQGVNYIIDFTYLHTISINTR